MSDDTASPARTKRPAVRRRRVLATLAVLVVTSLVGCNTLATYMVDRADKHVPRNADGIMKGAEACDLGPADAPNAVLFVHGFVGAGDNFNRLPQLAADAGWHVRVMRLPGHGTSPRDFENTTAEELQQAVRDEVASLRTNHKRVVLVGHSMGGSLITLVASEVPVDGLILGGPYFGITHHWYYGLKPEQWVKLSSHALRWMYKGEIFEQVNDKSKKRLITSYTWIPMKSSVTLMELGRRARQPEVLSRVTCPVLIFHSHGDVAASYKATEAAFNKMPAESKQLVWVNRSNHHVFWDYDSETIETETLAFLTKLGAPKVAATP